MSNFLRTIVTISLIFGCMTGGFSQEKYAKAYEKKGDKAFAQGNYAEALEHYTMGKRFLLKPISLIYKSGEACRMLKDYDKAEYWYQKVLIENDTLNINQEFPLLYLHLAEVAKCNGNLVQAQHFLNTCLVDCPDITIRKKAKAELESIKWIFENDTPLENTTVINIGKNVNNSFSQSGSYVINDSLLFFTSPVYKETKEDDEVFYSDIYNRIFLSYIDKDFYTPAKEMYFDQVNVKKKNSSNLFLDTITQTIYFNRCKTKRGKENCQIYFTQKQEGKWSKAKPLEQVYDKKSSNSSPIVARDEEGKAYMYFSSNRKGGFGGFDIWYVDLTMPETAPVNLGATINTTGNEITPHYCDDEQALYFSSDTHPGFGGYDIFKSEGWLQRWTKPENQLTPINSSANDIYPFIVTTEEQGYFTSNRQSENNVGNKTCCNDLYRWDKQLPEIPTEQVVKQKDVFNPAFDLPITLYFHNDEPNPNTTDTVTDIDYIQTYKEYRVLSNLYKANATRGLPDSLEADVVEKVDIFFAEKVDKGMQKLSFLAQYIYDKIKEGRSVSLQVRGYASALHNENYNHKLSQRRIVSVENYLKNWNGGILKPYFEEKAPEGEPRLQVVQMAFGKLESTSTNPETLEEKRRSVYTLPAMEDRRIEIRVVNVR